MSNMKVIGRVNERSRTVDVEWEIINFFSYTEENSRYYSPEFSVSNAMWQIEIWPIRTNSDSPTKSLSLYLCKIDNKVSKNVDFAVAIKSVRKVCNSCVNYECKKTKKFTFCDQSTNVVGWDCFVDRNKLLFEKENLVTAGTLTLMCSIVAQSDEQDFDSRPDKLIEDLRDMFSTTKGSDVILKINDDTISAHKAILTARSPVFAAMFENKKRRKRRKILEEKKTGEVNISDCDLNAFKIFLIYIYTGEVEFSKCDAFHLYKIADKYAVPELMMMCADFMIHSLSVENVSEVFVFGSLLNLTKLLTYTQHFFNQNFEKIVVSDTWKALLNEDCNLANELLKGMAPKVKILD